MFSRTLSSYLCLKFKVAAMRPLAQARLNLSSRLLTVDFPQQPYRHKTSDKHRLNNKMKVLFQFSGQSVFSDLVLRLYLTWICWDQNSRRARRGKQ